MYDGDVVSASELAATIAKAAVIFASTNVDDILLLAVFFSDKALRPRTIVAGQFLGITTLVLASVIAGLASVAIPSGYIALIGVVPLGLGLVKGIRVLRQKDEDDEPAKLGSGSQVLAIAGVTIANGGDNLGVYIPVFAVERAMIVVYAIVFGVLTAVWCFLGHLLVNNRAFGVKLQRYAHHLLPLVLIALGIHILLGARALL